MRIGIITHNFQSRFSNRQDAGVFVADFASKLKENHVVFVLELKTSGGKLGDWNIFNPTTPLRVANLLKNGERDALKFVETKKIDLVVAMWAIPAGIIADRVKEKIGTPYSIWSLGSDINLYAKLPIVSRLIKHALKNANFRFANSFKVKEGIEKISGNECIFLPAATDFSLKKIKKINLSTKTNLLFVGRLEKVKGIDLLIDAISSLNNKFHLYVIGSGSLEGYIQKTIRSLELNNITLVKQVNINTLASYMKAADYLIIPSRSESLPLVAIEAAHMGLPLIATDVGDLRRVIEKYKIGFVTKSVDAQSLSKTILKAVQVESKHFKPGLKKFARDFTIDKSIDEFDKTISTL